MALENVDINNLSIADLLRLIEYGVSEGRLIEYKRDLIGGTDDDKREFLKDVSSFANSSGGHLVIGMRAEAGIAAELVGCEMVDRDREVQRLDNMIRQSIEPRIVGLHVTAVDLQAGHSAIVVRVPRSWNPPHRVSYKSWNKFFVRNSNGAHETSVEELRSLFTASRLASERVRQFREERAQAIRNGNTPVPLSAHGRIAVHVVPLSFFLGDDVIDPQEAYKHRSSFAPIRSEGFGAGFNFDGLLLTYDVNNQGFAFSYTQVFRNGCLETASGNYLRSRDKGELVPSALFQRDVFGCIPRFCEGLAKLQIDPPLIVMVSLLGVSGSRLGIQDEWGTRDNKVLDRPDLLLPPVTLNSSKLEGRWHHLLRPVFDATWNAYGHPTADWFDKDGRWTPPR